jgi:hypothetical protein
VAKLRLILRATARKMHRSRRVEVGIRGTSADTDRISTPWKRSKNRLVQDEWRLQTGALSPTHGKVGREQTPAVGQRAQTAQGHHERPQSPFSQASGHGHSIDKQQLERSLSSLHLSYASRMTRTSSPLDDSTQLPTLWVQDRYFVRPKTQVRICL